MNDIEDITHIAGKFKKISEVKLYADKLFNALKDATEQLKHKDREIEHLKTLLIGTVSNIVPPSIPKELLVCEMEIARIQKEAENRALEHEEVKSLSMLINNLIAIKKHMKETRKENPDHSVDIDESKLIQIVKYTPKHD